MAMETNEKRSCTNCKFKDRLITQEPCMNCRDLDEPVWHDNWEENKDE